MFAGLAAVGTLEGAGVDLVEDQVLPPGLGAAVGRPSSHAERGVWAVVAAGTASRVRARAILCAAWKGAGHWVMRLDLPYPSPLALARTEVLCLLCVGGGDAAAAKPCIARSYAQNLWFQRVGPLGRIAGAFFCL